MGYEFKLYIAGDIDKGNLSSLSKVSAQKMVMKVLSNDLKTKIHALEISIEK